MIDVTGWQWSNEPRSWSAAETLSVHTDPDTDFWRTTHYGFVRDTGHVLAREVSGDFRLRTSFTGAYTHQYDQAGAMLRIDAENWVKTGIEFVDGRQHASVVVTRGFSDWSVTPIEATDRVSIEIERSGDTVTVRYGVGAAEPTTMLRLAYYPPAVPTLAGVMCASPDGPGFDVAFDRLELTTG
jgi:regulation of enolase protein 1 (concanavalin A-like superfamily)